MKRTFERIGFMLVGALLVCGAYLVGKTDQTANAQTRIFHDVRFTGDVVIEGALLVGETASDRISNVFIVADAEGSQILLNSKYQRSTNKADATIFISATETRGLPDAFIRVYDKYNDGFTGSSLNGWTGK